MTTAEAINSLRAMLRDRDEGNFVRNENLTPQRTDTNIIFFLEDFRKELGGIVVDGSLTVTANGEAVTATLSSATQGKITLDSVPDNPAFASYNWQYFSDLEYTQFLADALDILQYDAIASVPGALRQALVYYAASRAYDALVGRANMILKKKDAVVEIDGTKAPDTWMKASKEAFAKAQAIHEQYNRGMFTQLRPYLKVHEANLGNMIWTPRE